MSGGNSFVATFAYKMLLFSTQGFCIQNIVKGVTKVFNGKKYILVLLFTLVSLQSKVSIKIQPKSIQRHSKVLNSSINVIS